MIDFIYSPLRLKCFFIIGGGDCFFIFNYFSIWKIDTLRHEQPLLVLRNDIRFPRDLTYLLIFFFL